MQLTIENFQILFDILSKTIVYVPVPNLQHNMAFRTIKVLKIENVALTSTGSMTCRVVWTSRHDDNAYTKVDCRIDDSTEVIWCEISYMEKTMITFEIQKHDFIKWKLEHA